MSPAPELINHLPVLFGELMPPEPPAERFERIADTRYVRVGLTVDRHAYGIVVNSNPFTHELLVEWWNPVLHRVQTDRFCLIDVHPLGELRDVLAYVDSRGQQRRGFVVCLDGDYVELEVWQQGATRPQRARVHIGQVQPFARLLEEGFQRD